MILLVLTLIIQYTYCEWVSEWQTPKELQFKVPSDNMNQLFDQFKRSLQNIKPLERTETSADYLPLKFKLESTLKSAKELADNLNRQIRDIEIKERFLKEAIAYGKSGVTTLNILTTSREPSTYIIRDGFWYICDGLVQNSVLSSNFLNEIIATPKCIGQEIPSIRDPCVFNSIIKYEAIPTVRRAIYEEENFLCLKPNFNVTLEQYQSVPKQVMNDTCKKGTIKSLSENLSKCGARILSEYSYYPNRNTLPAELLEYCTENDGSCKLMVAWYFSNASIENYETLSNDKIYKRTFLKMGSFKQTEM